MAAAAVQSPAPPTWTHHFETLKRENLFRSPPKDREAHPPLAEAFKPHIESFNSVFEPNGFLEEGLRDIGTKACVDREGNQLDVRIREYFLEKPVLPSTNKFSISNRNIYPSECRERHATYGGRFRVRLDFRVGSKRWSEDRDLGKVPIILRSKKCHLENAAPAELVRRKEEAEDFGGYFIVNGIEKIVRMLAVTKRNCPLAIVRPSYKDRGRTYTEFAVQIRSTRRDQTSQGNTLHYLSDGNVIFRFSWRRNEYLLPVVMIMRALVDTNDREIFQGFLGTLDEETLQKKQSVIERLETLLRTYRYDHGMYGKSRIRAKLGSGFRVVLNVPDTASDEECGTYFLRKIVLPHLGAYDVTAAQDKDKYNLLLFMLKKLYAVVEKECSPDNPDAVSSHEVLLGGFLYGMVLKEKLEEWLHEIRTETSSQSKEQGGKLFTDPTFEQELRLKILRKTGENIGSRMEYFLATGNLHSPTGLDTQQASGFTIVAEKLNFFRFLSHFRMVHRGSYYATMKTTSVRKLLPESWGFLCPVHTPDGAPCGLLNHLAHQCKIATKYSDVSTIPSILASMGITDHPIALTSEPLAVQLDGCILGYTTASEAQAIATTLRQHKTISPQSVPPDLEIGYIPLSQGGQYPGIYICSNPARMYRPVKHLATGRTDYVGPFEQPYMAIACTNPEVDTSYHTHVEFAPTHILDIVSNQTPFSDFNQSPRNMYQCQMGKQTMGTPGAAIRYRADNKTYRLECGQTPLVRPPLHNEYGLDAYPQGTNAIVAVISYTGYDMDDAMIVNKQAHERGFANGSICKTEKIDLSMGELNMRSFRTVRRIFGFAPGGMVKAEWRNTLGDDGLPRVGAWLRKGDVMAASHDVDLDPVSQELTNRDMATRLHRYKADEDALVEKVILHGTEEGNAPLFSASIKLRVPRAPIIGDKFSSRHGQKGVMSQRWPTQDMPFSESGMVPDVIINPHAFPSRMTIGMFVESMAGKAGAMHGFAQDSTPWRFEDKKGNTAVEYFAEQLREAGYNYYGNEPMYSGITGTELAADIYIGVVYYQRLRHMVNDKYQVRTTGPVTSTTGQPVKGRTKGGGIRIGEMEKDALLAHGTAFLLQDRLLNCSDYTRAWICRSCGSFLSTQPTVGGFGPKRRGTNVMRCRRCAKSADPWMPKGECWEDGQGQRWTGGEDTTVVAIPGVLRYLDVELAAMGVQMKFHVSP